jgi:uncharacterized membrane protein YhaH (DUF805 family)
MLLEILSDPTTLIVLLIIVGVVVAIVVNASRSRKRAVDGSQAASSTTGLSVSFPEAVRSGFRNYTNFSGQSSRSEFWWWYLFNFAVSFGLYIVASVTGRFSFALSYFFFFAWWAAVLGLIVPNLAVAIRRLHDTNRSGVYYLFCLIPLVGSILLLVWWAEPSSEITWTGRPQGQPVTGAMATQNSRIASVDVAEQIKKLGDLKAQGLLTESEFEDKKKALLDRL